MTLTAPQTAALAAICAAPMKLDSGWQNQGHRRQTFFFANAEHSTGISTVVSLGILGLVDVLDNPKDPEELTVQATPEGLALLAKMEARAHG